MKIAICDNDKYFCDELYKILNLYNQEYKIFVKIDIFTQSKKLINELTIAERFDLVFLDIEIDELTGIDIGTHIRENLDDYITKIIYSSSKNQYDRQLFATQPFGFLEKPINKENVFKLLETFKKTIITGKSSFVFSKSGQRVVLSVKNIIYFEIFNREITIHATDRKDDFYGKLSDVSNDLDENTFIQIHRSYIVNYEHIKSIRQNEVVMSNGDILSVSRRKYKELMDFHLEHLRGK